MTISPELTARLEAAEQTHVTRFWTELNDDERNQLRAQLDAINFEQIKKLSMAKTENDQWGELAARASSPPAITLEDFANREKYEEAYQAGVEAIKRGKVAMILTAGGQGSRLGFEHPKGMFPIGPVSHRTLYQVIIEKVHARAQQFGASIPFFVMTSPPTHQGVLRVPCRP